LSTTVLSDVFDVYRKARLIRKRKFLEFIITNPGWKKDKLLAVYSNTVDGLSRRTLREYYIELLEGELIYENDGHVFYKDYDPSKVNGFNPEKAK
jgi:hypothetical protein